MRPILSAALQPLDEMRVGVTALMDGVDFVERLAAIDIRMSSRSMGERLWFPDVPKGYRFPLSGFIRMANDLRAPLSPRMAHLCIDMQRIFSADGLWPAPWMTRVLPVVTAISERFAARTIFTRFITPRRPEDLPGTWQGYYRRWREATREHLDPEMLELMPPLKACAPPAVVIDKTRYSAFAGSSLRAVLAARGADGLVITGSETDVCVLSTVLDAVDIGLRVVLVRDGICSSSDEGHDALLSVYQRRYSFQVETTNAETVLRTWPVAQMSLS